MALNGEVMPSSSFTNLPKNYTKRNLYNMYVEVLKDMQVYTLSKTSFLRFWRDHFPHVKIPN